MIEDTYISDNIISYLNIPEKIFINKFYYKQSKDILNSKVRIIENFYLKRKLYLQMVFEYLDEDNLQAIRNYYIIFYPKEYRKSFFEQVLKYRARYLSNNSYLTVINLLEQSILTNNYNKHFKQLINLLQINDLAFIGW
jgi:hypothetical protein